MSTGYSGTPLPRKLGLEGARRLLLVDPPAQFVGTTLRVPPTVRVGDLRMHWADLAIAFVTARSRLEVVLPRVVERLTEDGAFWVAWPKRTSGVATDMSGDVVRAVVLPTGLVDVKVAAIDDTWSALKCVIRRELRGGARPSRHRSQVRW